MSSLVFRQHGEVEFCMIQLRGGHGDFRAHLHRFKGQEFRTRKILEDEACGFCPSEIRKEEIER